jgi:hypothetical protein
LVIKVGGSVWMIYLIFNGLLQRLDGATARKLFVLVAMATQSILQ